MIKDSIDSLFDSIDVSSEYRDYQSAILRLKSNKTATDLIEKIKVLEKEATKLEYSGQEEYKVIDKEIEDNLNILNAIEEYREYKNYKNKFNTMLLASSSLIEEYIDSKISI